MLLTHNALHLHLGLAPSLVTLCVLSYTVEVVLVAVPQRLSSVRLQSVVLKLSRRLVFFE